eukprot:CAMPEP_0119508134 /NCGR_PEP_ID=MMETSP1344-20130328/27829_1 /TAXON_ID=236787 /ORGANISM="Florenciella parvula, Strain CCMP2471" /LENGTH=48 /DNA_ID= /DNA_START= /DNA_END= /DNA_ORIENTATION=
MPISFAQIAIFAPHAADSIAGSWVMNVYDTTCTSTTARPTSPLTVPPP